MLAADPPNLEGARETARRAMRDGNRAAEVIARLRALFSKKATAFELVDVNEAAREVLGLFSKDARREQVAVHTSLCEGPCIVMGDRIQLQQVILNLLRNALDAMKEARDGSKELRIETGLEAGDRVLLRVRDSGMGIGLSVSRSIVESHHGRLWATQNEGAGATFSMSLPLAPESFVGAA